MVRHLPRLQSNHSPILIKPKGGFILPVHSRSFRFHVAWFTHKEFLPFVESNWYGSVLVNTALNDFSIVVKKWNSNVFGNAFYKKKRLIAKIECVLKRLISGAALNLFNLERNLQKDLDEILKQEEIIWFQKSRQKWITLGDKKNKVFSYFYPNSEEQEQGERFKAG